MRANRRKTDFRPFNRRSGAKLIHRVLRGKLYQRQILLNDLLTCPEVAAYGGWSLRWVYELLRRGKLKAVRLRGRRVIPASQVICLKIAREGPYRRRAR